VTLLGLQATISPNDVIDNNFLCWKAEFRTMNNLRLSALTIMLCFGWVSACAQSPPSSQTQPEADAATALGDRAAEATDAAAMASGSEDGKKEQAPMTTEMKPEKAVGPPIASTLLQERILRFIDGIRSPSDMARGRLEEVMQVRLEQDADFKDSWWYTGATDENWDYTVKLKEKRDQYELPLVDISFSAGDFDADKRATVCTYELEAFAHSLTDLGYTRHPRWVQPGAQLLFARKAEDARFGSTVAVKKYVQQNGPGEDDFQYCVYVIYISAGESLDDE
jgi:hypothetical protein